MPEIAHVLKIYTSEANNERMFQLQKLEEDKIMAIQHQEAQKHQQKSWHGRNIKTKNILVGDLVLLYDSKIKGKPRKLETTWTGPYIFKILTQMD